jgi:hypothetical protein
LLEAAPSGASNAGLKLVALSLQHGRAEQRDLLTLGDTTYDFGVVKIAYADAHRSRRILIALLDEHHHRSACATAGETASRRATCTALTRERAAR